ncbi:helix-turn-helix domain-containing protein [Oleomonas cavernae]|uniref:Helix-turn-helix domain-containing protein n=1 Tax=Oleomonas cavernae TaxID=2320859 RepID=A0A418WES5_9PROT|nr:helix-turn-helix domain-containing protein [Oleomonas cavernae]RJF88513.1 helix-turn-helix domain-containing protein [Oleomonas cavernae]
MTKTGQASRLTKALLETADDMRRTGVMDAAMHEKITLRHLGAAGVPAEAPIGPEDIRAIRQAARLSQAVFARYLNMTPGYVSQLERGVKRPTGPALALLNIIRRKGIDVVF